MPSRIGTVVPVSENEVLAALEDGIYLVDLNSKKLELFSDIEATMTENRFNDGKCDPSGNLWVGSMHLNQEQEKAKLYKIDGPWKCYCYDRSGHYIQWDRMDRR